jgi:hypothetical protein
MYLVARRGAFDSLACGGELAGAAAVRCVQEFAGDVDLAAWRRRPGKVMLRARGGQWEQLLEEESHVVVAGAVAALPPRRRSQRGPLLERMQAMMTALEPPPERVLLEPGKVTYLVNPRLEMSSGKTLAQIAHAAVMAAGADGAWARAGCPAHVVAPLAEVFDAVCASPALLARVVDAGLTEVPPGTVTVLALKGA